MMALFFIGLSISFIVMAVWPLMDGWFKDLEEGDSTWDEDWNE